MAFTKKKKLTEQLDERVEPEGLRPQLVSVQLLVGHLHLLQADPDLRLVLAGLLAGLDPVLTRQVLLEKGEIKKLLFGKTVPGQI